MSGVTSDRVLADLELTRGLTIQMLAIGTLGMLVGWVGFSAIYQLGTGDPVSLQFAPASFGWLATPVNVLVLVFLGTVILVPHEWLHGLAIRYYGGEPRYGVGVAHFVLPYAYATTDHEFTRNQFVVVLLTPLVVMTAVGVPLMLVFEWGWLVVPLALNAAGAVADVWMTLMALGYPAHVRIVDHESGVRILGRETDRPRSLSITSLVWDALSGAAVALFAVFVLLAVVGPFVLSALGVESLTVGTPGKLTYLFAFVNTPEEISISVGPGILSLGALLGLVYAFARSYRRGTRPSVHTP
ncbi:DUF3267 domain-containing protein [Halorarius litoreus]|uniref:DUF3267 domain-containing protein n=1 Tax=Halorarius litoreus TaxID=2962676 RepID=UPI0020CEF651|nr:DUF3267 domain-containing protein [Halorarius litoreus]